MTLRVLSHATFAPSYDQQLLDNMETSSLEDILNDLEANSRTVFGETSAKIHTVLSKHTWSALAYKVSCHLDDLLVRKTAEECRDIFDLIRVYCNFNDISELQFIYEQLKEHFKCSGNPMPGLRFTDNDPQIQDN